MITPMARNRRVFEGFSAMEYFATSLGRPLTYDFVRSEA